MQWANRRPQSKRATSATATMIGAPALATVLMFGFSFGAYAATQPASTPVATSWAQSVRSHLAAQAASSTEAGVAGAESDTTGSAVAQPAAFQPATTRPVTAWARTVEARLAERAHRVAAAGRSALAWSESGVASWYGRRGRSFGRTSSGERFDPMQLTCAHPTLPLGTKVLVTSETTGRSVVVTVNDRGPFTGRIVDLSRAAAARIGMLGSGTDSVTIQEASPEVIEVAQAAESDTSAQAVDVAASDGGSQAGLSASRSPHGRRHMRLADR